MKLAIILAALLLGAPSFAGETGSSEEVIDPEPTPQQKIKIKQLVKDLAAEDHDTRQAARNELVKIGRPALRALNEAARSDDLEVAESARKLIEQIRKGKMGTSIKVLSSGSIEKGNFEKSLVSSTDTVTVRIQKDAFVVALQSASGNQLYSEPTRAEFQKKHPEIWKTYAEPLLDEKNPNRAIKEAMVREVMPQVKSKFKKAMGRDPNAEELAALEKAVRQKLDAIFNKNGSSAGKTGSAPTTAGAPSPPPKEDVSKGPQLVPLD